MKKLVVILSCLFLVSTGLLAQKGQKSISAGSLVSFPVDNFYGKAGNGYGIEVNGQHGFTERSSIVAQAAFFAYPSEGWTYERLSFITLKGGYRYQFGPSGIYLNGLVGLDLGSSYGFPSAAVTLGGGKRFTFKNQNQVDVGIDLVGGDATPTAVNLKAALLLFKK